MTYAICQPIEMVIINWNKIIVDKGYSGLYV